MNKIFFLGASVALIIFVDLANGQGPPALNNYMAQVPPPPDYRPLPPTMQAINYMPRGEYDGVNSKKYKEPKSAYKVEKGEYTKEKEEYSKDKDYDKVKDYDKYKSTPAPGVLGSFSNSMSDAWKSLTSLGRQTRSAKDERSEDKPAASSGRAIGEPSK